MHGFRFPSALAAIDPRADSRIRIRTHPRLDHFAVTTEEAALDSAIDWLLR
jgi:hypothetical protein